ncbi:O-methyltransferase [Mycena sanguinolenta]|uniref:O-methyltransferase n=1 Tax=Mycena sanguinolenta TaxID=230812 RepID=A0A8H7DKW5_9AGAR|nr:O-methyltransferase [Mycena sanguinolenta]
MTFAVLRALHTLLGDALNDIEAVYASAQPQNPSPTHRKTNSFSRVYASPPPSPSSSSTATSNFSASGLDFPSLDAPDKSHRCGGGGQMAATVQVPFLTLCDASMGYHLPSCLRVLEAAHVVEVLRDGPVHVKEIAARTGIEQAKLAHVLRLLATHHILREAAPDVFAANRISSLIDSGKPLRDLLANPERKYESIGDSDASAVAAFVGLCTDELFKSSAYLTEAIFPGNARLCPASTPSSLSAGSSTGDSGTSSNSLSKSTNNAASTPTGSDPTRAPFNYAFGCGGVGYFAWLEGEGWAEEGRRAEDEGNGEKSKAGSGGGGGGGKTPTNPNRFRLERFGKAMAGTGELGGARGGVAWCVPALCYLFSPGSLLFRITDDHGIGFDWASLPRGSVVVDVGGGIGSTSMLLASAYADVDAEGGGGLRFVIQDRPVVVEMGEKAWRAKCPELLDTGIVRFQVHDFFTPQPVTDAAVFILRVVLHDWPDAFAQRILLRLREAAAPHTKLVLADFVLPLACVDDFGVGEGEVEKGGQGREQESQVEGAEKMLAPAPLLANLGKASANAYWMDLTKLTGVGIKMQVTFNGQERTLREIVALALSAGWKVVRVTKAPGSLFGHIVAVPVAVPVPPQRRARAGSGSAFFDVGMSAAGGAENAETGEMEMVERASSRCGTPTFGSRVDLPSVAEARARFGGGIGGRRPFATGSRAPPPVPLKQAPLLTSPALRKKKPSPLSVAPPPLAPSPNPSSYRPVTSPRPQPAQQPTSPIARRTSQAPLRTQSQQQPLAPSPVPRQAPPPPSPMSPRNPLSRRSSYAHLSQTAQSQSQPPSQASTPTPTPQPHPLNTLRHVPSSPVLKQTQHQHHQHSHSQPSPPSPVPSRIPALTRRASHAQLQLPQTELRKRSGSIITPSMVRAAGGEVPAAGNAHGHGLGSLLLPGRTSGGALDFGARRRRRENGDGDSESADVEDELVSRRASSILPPRAVGAGSRGAD